jgi:hypothetical protein
LGTYLSNTLIPAQQAAPADLVNANGAGLGYVDIYDTNGKLIKQLIAGGAQTACTDELI